MRVPDDCVRYNAAVAAHPSRCPSIPTTRRGSCRSHKRSASPAGWQRSPWARRTPPSRQHLGRRLVGRTRRRKQRPGGFWSEWLWYRVMLHRRRCSALIGWYPAAPNAGLFSIRTSACGINRRAKCPFCLDLLADSTLPQPLRLGPQSISWRRREILEWIQSIPRAGAACDGGQHLDGGLRDVLRSRRLRRRR